jgi:hypothetical protein
MTAVKFIRYPDPDNSHAIAKVVVSSKQHDLSLGEIVELFEQFLHGSGYPPVKLSWEVLGDAE